MAKVNWISEGMLCCREKKYAKRIEILGLCLLKTWSWKRKSCISKDHSEYSISNLHNSFLFYVWCGHRQNSWKSQKSLNFRANLDKVTQQRGHDILITFSHFHSENVIKSFAEKKGSVSRKLVSALMNKKHQWHTSKVTTQNSNSSKYQSLC